MSETLDQELVEALDDLKNTVGERVDRKLTDFRAEMLRAIRERTARPPGLTGNDPAPGAAPELLRSDKRFSEWLGSPRGRQSSVTLNVPFPWEKKAAVMNVGGTAHAAGIAGPPQLPLRVTELIPSVPISSGSAIEYTREISYVP